MINPTVSLTGDYDAQLAAIQQRQKLADLLQQQSMQPIDIPSYNGIQAHMSPLAGLAKVLQAYQGARLNRDALSQTASLKKGEQEDYAKQIAALLQGADTGAAPPAAPAPQATPPGPPQPTVAPPVAPAGPLVAALAAHGAQPDASAPAPDAGPTVAPPMAPAPVPAPLSPLDQAKAQYAKAVQLMGSSNPMVRQAAPELMKQAQEQIKKLSDLQDVSRQKLEDKKADIAQAVTLVSSLPGITDDQRDYLKSVASSGGMEAIKPALGKLSEVNFAPHVRTATPDELKGYPAGTIAQVDNTGKLINVYNPSEDKNREAQLKLAQQNLGLRSQEVAIAKARLSQESLGQPATIEYQVNGEPVQVTAAFDKKAGHYVNLSTGQAITNPQGLRLLPSASGAGRSAMGITRTLTSAHDAVTGIENLSNLDNRADVGMFPNLETSPKASLTRTLTPQQVQSAQATMGGLGRALAGLASGGLAPDQNTLRSYEALTPSQGDTQLTKMRKLAEMRQQTENALDVQSVSPLLTPDQKKQVLDLKARVAKAIPWTVPDVQRLENSKDPHASLRSLGISKTGAGSNDIRAKADAILGGH